MTLSCDLIINNVNLASMQDNKQPYGTIPEAAVAIKDGRVEYAGPMHKCEYQGIRTIDGNGQWLLPGLIDCHTHLIYGGNRAQEFEQRLLGASYEDIARQGGGIKSTVTATRAAEAQSLLNEATKRARALLSEGVTTIEVKSGYGLDLENEIKMLEVAQQLASTEPVNIVSTYLGAHTVPTEYQSDADGYINYICTTVMPKIASRRLATFVDVFCETIGFTPAQCEKVFSAAQRYGLKIKAHVEQLSDLKGAVLAAKYGAKSVDHIEYLAEEDVGQLKRDDTVAVLLPGAFYFLQETTKPPVSALRKHEVPMAIATDLNPGSSPMASLLTAMNMACVLFALTPEEALRGCTLNAAKALDLPHKGKIAPGYDADFCLWDIAHPSELAYGINLVKPTDIWIGGKHV